MERTVYQPAEDSQLLADVASTIADPEDVVIDVGTGSGYVGATLKEASGARVIGTDRNPHACQAAADQLDEVCVMDLTAGIANDVADMVCFNPPYLPTEEESTWDDWMELALDGGPSGRAVIDPFLQTVGRVLSEEGVVILLVSSLTGVEAVTETAGEAGFHAAIEAEESFPYETLSVLRLWH